LFCWDLHPYALRAWYSSDFSPQTEQARKSMMKAAASELGELRSSLEGEAWSLEVLCSKMMKRKTLYLCTADPQNPVSVCPSRTLPGNSSTA
jgi:hypothetical protein